MMISPETYISQYKNRTLKECIEARDKLIQKLKDFELDPVYESDVMPSPMTQYNVYVEYLKGLCDLIAEKVSEADPDYDPEILSTIEIRKCGITSTGADVVVNAANRYLQEGSGVCGAIFKAAGSKKLQAACDKIGGCKTGKAVITPGFDLSKYIIHAVGPIFQDGRSNEARDLYSCYICSLDLARGNGCRSIAFPLISAGIYGYPKKEAWRKALQACDDWIRENSDYEIEIIFTIIDDDTLDLGKMIAEELNIELK